MYLTLTQLRISVTYDKARAEHILLTTSSSPWEVQILTETFLYLQIYFYIFCTSVFTYTSFYLLFSIFIDLYNILLESAQPVYPTSLESSKPTYTSRRYCGQLIFVLISLWHHSPPPRAKQFSNPSYVTLPFRDDLLPYLKQQWPIVNFLSSESLAFVVGQNSFSGCAAIVSGRNYQSGWGAR